MTLNGTYIDLFDPALPVKKEVTVQPGTQALLVDVAAVADRKRPQVLAASFRECDEKVTSKSYTFTAKSPIDTDGIARILLPRAPKSVVVDDVETVNPANWDTTSKTYLLTFDNTPDGHTVTITY